MLGTWFVVGFFISLSFWYVIIMYMYCWKKKLFSILYLRTQLYDIKKIHYRAWLNLIQGHQPHLLDEFFPLLVFFLIIRRFSRLCHSIMKAIYPSIFAVIDFVKKWLAKIAFSSLNRLAMRNNDAGVWSGTVRKWSPFHNHYKWQWLNPMIKIHPSTLAKSFDCFIRPISLICRCYTAFFFSLSSGAVGLTSMTTAVLD